MKAEMMAISALLTFCVVTGSGCDHSVGPGLPSGDHVYFNSFESPQDTVGWRGYGGMQFRNDAPPGAGRRSIFISGGCLHPHAYVEFNGIDKDSYLLLRCWGKNLAIGGGVELQLAEDMSKAIHIEVADTTWRFYQAAEALFWPARHRLKLSLSSGGIVASAMVVDQIEVIKID